VIVDGRTLGCWWDPGVPGTRERSEPIRGVVWHWTAGIGAPKSVYRTLIGRSLSIHFVIGSDGSIVQMADPATTVCSHAGPRGNPAFIGVEIVSRGVEPCSPKLIQHPRLTTVRGRRVKALDFLPAQYVAIENLGSALSLTHGIPAVVPGHTNTLAPSELAKYRGHLEHIHVSSRKIDCGGFVMDHLARHWSEP
jgi:N-acetyl-anhydromuramyl-L-alanine amidase AmpD